MGWLEQPSQMDYRVRPIEMRGQIVTGDIHTGKGRLRPGPFGRPAGQAPDLIHRRIAGKGIEQRRSHIARGSGNNHPHPRVVPRVARDMPARLVRFLGPVAYVVTIGAPSSYRKLVWRLHVRS